MTLTSILTLLTGLAFVGYGIACVFTQHMVQEFRRYGLEPFRLVVGYLEIAGGMGLCLGWLLNWPEILVLSALGLCILMVMGLYTRIRIHDPLKEMMPALILMMVTFWIAFYTWSTL